MTHPPEPPPPTPPLLSLSIPAYNEHATILDLIARVRAVPIEKEIVVVDDCSTDGTDKVLASLGAQPDLRVVRHAVNQGKGAALRTGIAASSASPAVLRSRSCCSAAMAA